jgi:branched-chain amino acid transport system ATP-binding protein
MLLEIKDLKVAYGKIQAVKGISLHINAGEIVTLVGANGAGKTTLLKTISGLLKPSSGVINFEGKDIQGINPHSRVLEGLCQAPEGRGIFPGMTVLENLEMGKYARKDWKNELKEDLDRIYTLFPRLKERQSQEGGTLSGGEQQMLSIGRALMSRPRLLLLDEPSMGLAPKFIQQIFNIIREIQSQGVSILLVEQNAAQALSCANRAYILETGNITKEGAGKELLNDEAIKKAYLGTGA